MAKTLDQICAEFDALIHVAGDRDMLVDSSVTFLGQVFNAVADEVAILELDSRNRFLRFLVPERLRQMGFIPLSSPDSLAARTAREGSVFLENTFARQRHPGFFEMTSLPDGVATMPMPVQKIISAPIVCGNAVRGVIQITRKGCRDDVTIPDFTDHDAALLLELAGLFGERL